MSFNYGLIRANPCQGGKCLSLFVIWIQMCELAENHISANLLDPPRWHDNCLKMNLVGLDRSGQTDTDIVFGFLKIMNFSGKWVHILQIDS